MIRIDAETGHMWCPDKGIAFADSPYVYSLRGRVVDREVAEAGLGVKTVTANEDGLVVQGMFEELQIELMQRLSNTSDGVEETITFKNLGDESVTLSDIGLGFAADLDGRPNWRLCAIPFRVQLDGSRHDYSATDLIEGNFSNAVYRDETRPEPPLTEDGRLRSEAWAWWADGLGLLVAKYNPADVELSVAAPLRREDRTALRFGGVGTCLYGEPSKGHSLVPGQSFTFGTTHYLLVEGVIENAFVRYRELLDRHGHGVPVDYDPPVNWNELYDIGWYHSDPEKLKSHYTRDALLREAEKARACGCELLYLDPGWEVAEGTTLWDEDRLGTVESFAALLQREYGLGLGFRTILRCYRQHWDQRHTVQHLTAPKAPIEWGGQQLWEVCLCDPSFREQKIERILDVASRGSRFLMVDEMDWRGPCHDVEHGHDVPTTATHHLRAVYELCRELKRRCPQLTIECHDPVWPWHTCIYAPTYFQQGFGDRGAYEENWGFEYMWNCLEDLHSGKALALYYYNLSCNIPLYLHITMAADNDNCLFFWWAASTVRHLGIGGKHGHPSVNPKCMPTYDPEQRFAAYQKQMTIYKQLKPYFTRGTFHGLRENVHLHTLPGRKGGVLLMFNITEVDQAIEARIDQRLLQTGGSPQVEGAVAITEDGVLRIQADIPAMSAAVVRIGDAVERSERGEPN